MSTDHPIDIVGDVRGHLATLEELAIELGYDITRGWRHAEGRVMVFLGGLVGRGRHNLAVAEQVMQLVADRRAVCLLGDQEHDLVARRFGLPGHDDGMGPRPPIPDAERWEAAIDFFRDLPLALELPDLRILHGCWHAPSVRAVRAVLGQDCRDEPAGTFTWLQQRVSLRSPFTDEGLVDGLPGETGGDVPGVPHEVLLKGPLVPTPIFYVDVDGQRRHHRQPMWWHDDEVEVLRDRVQVFGNYGHLPPILGHFAPPHPLGSRERRKWLKQVAPMVPRFGATPMVGDCICVDFDGFEVGAPDKSCVGALRWPEREVVWMVKPTARRPLTV